MISTLTKIAAGALFASVSAFAWADIVTIEGFENEADPANWQMTVSSPGSNPNQTLNAAAIGQIPQFVATNVTEGIRAGRFQATWTTASAVQATQNLFDPSGPLTYWGIRYNINGPSALNQNAISNTAGLLAMDVANENQYPVQVALVVDSQASAQLERGPLVTVPAQSSIVYTWDFSTSAPVGFATGDGVFSGTESRLKSLLVYTDVQPTADTFNLTVDNIRNGNAPDLNPPPIPEILAATAGVGTNVNVSWLPSVATDLAGYRVYRADYSDFSSTTLNRLTFPATPIATVGPGNLSVTVPATVASGCFFAVTAVDNATTANESGRSHALPVHLAPAGQPMDRIVFDNNHFPAGAPGAVANGYAHAAAYIEDAMYQAGRHYDSVTARTIDLGIANLYPDSDTVIVWSNLLDGQDGASVSLTAPSRAAITALLADDGNLLISGTNLAEDLVARGQSQFLTDILGADLVSTSSGISNLTGTRALGAVGSFSTGINPMVNEVAYSTTANDVVTPAGVAEAAALYTGIPEANGTAGITLQSKVVFLPFALESAGSPAGPEASRTVRKNLVTSAIDYLLGVTAAHDWQLYP